MRRRHDRRVWETTDPDGRRVRLLAEGWLHILEQHAELYLARNKILGPVAAPVARVPSRDVAEEWYFGSGFGPSRFVKVVVHYEGEVGLIVTAFPRRAVP